ncbi:outer membrane protein transport protein [Pseudomonas yamanorum]|jgi:long-chain fatty acid transport protein|uniref:Outer membrane protein transport protein n=2 Tax=Pseudomonas TaxID=286 RepID=A0A7Y8EGT6_9PSED|nr:MULTISPECIES: outer membrane protein transport protein [Pseudomonas]MCS3417578.1 long-chain fatty acid transport protein [Pseudomonas sp. BIGb0558]MCS3437539.1 long-chain fatty acid transport protein [Pseudomonas sp. BIGb0450]NVZ83122.1 outer membrane protein transport protein [Pseudomonas yamanorum]NWE14421.1 outer membrane protein transport protein [Pseudomonas yamanorum]NWE41609.1 outer membrane protein transport protein [Pseudomonas yamanorum]
MNNKKQHAHTLLGLALLGGLMTTGQAQAGGFSTPTFGAPGWGRAFGGGSLFKNDPSAAYNNPAAMAFIDSTIAQQTVDYARVKIKYTGQAYDYAGNPVTNTPVLDDLGNTGDPVLNTNNGGQGGFTAWLPTGFLVIPMGDRFAFGLSQVVPQGMKTTWNEDSKLRDFAVDTKIETIGLTGSLSFKVNDQFSVGGGAIVQRSQGFVSQNIDLLAAADVSPGLGGAGLPTGLGHSLMRVKVDNISVGWFGGVVWKPTLQDTLGLNYHAKIKNKMTGKYNIYTDAVGRNAMTNPIGPNGETLVEIAYPGLKLFPDGAHASTQLDIPATASVDWVHEFNDRWTLGVSATWTEWSSFQDLTLKSQGTTIVAIPYNYKNAWMTSIGGDYKATDELTLRAGVAYDQTPTRNSTRDPRIPDGDRYFLAFGAGYDIKAVPGLSVDAAYSHQFVQKVNLKTKNVDRLGAAQLDGEAESSGDVVSLSATYKF